MSVPRSLGRQALPALSLIGTLLGVPDGYAASSESARPVPRASCGPHDRTESGLQGQTTFAERFSPGSTRAYNCNLELTGQFEGEGAGFIMQVHENCAYYSTWPYPQVQRPGVVARKRCAQAGHPKDLS